MRPSLCFCLLSLTFSTLATPFTTAVQELTQRFNPHATDVHPHPVRSPAFKLSQLDDNRLTNAMRLAMGYPLKPPRRRATLHKSRSMLNATARGYMEVVDADSHQLLGYVSNAYNKYGEYGVLTNNSAGYLLASLAMDGPPSGSSVISTINGPLATYPFFGLISGFDSTSADLKEGHYNYAVFGGTVRRPANSPATQGDNSFARFTGITRPIETAIFSYDLSSNEIGCHWVNEDGSTPITYLGYNEQEAALFVTGDMASFTDKYGTSSVRWVTLKLISEH